MEYKRLGDIATYINGYPFKPEDRGSEGLPIIRIQDLTGNSYDLGFYSGEYPARIEVNVGDVLISWSASLGVYVWDRGKALLNQHIFKVVFDKEDVNKDFFVFAVRHKLKEMESKTHGATMRHIIKKDFDNTTIPFPSLEKQAEIADILSIVENVIVSRQQELSALDDLIKARFVEMFGDLMENPFEWPVMKISDISTFLKSGLSRKLSDDDIGIPVIRSGNIQNSQFIYDEVKYWYVDDPQGANTKDYVLDDGDILINFINSLSQIGKTAVFRDVGRDCIYTTNIFRMKLAENCNEYYYNWYAMSDYYYRHLRSIIQPAVNQASFTTVNFLKLPIPLPPIARQEEFAHFVKQVDKSKLVLNRAINEAQILFDSLMQQYFN